MDKPEYWFCIIGPFDRNKLHLGADFPLRDAVQKAYVNMTKDVDFVCSSGWGMNPEKYEKVRDVITNG